MTWTASFPPGLTWTGRTWTASARHGSLGGVTSDAYVSMGTSAARNVLAALEDEERHPH